MSGEDKLTLTLLPQRYALCRMSPETEAPPEIWNEASFVSVTRTEDELSIVCPESSLPAHGKNRRGMRVFRVEGSFSFSSVGILLSLLEPLANSGISILAISTYDTDYILVHEDDLVGAISVLEKVCVLRDV